MLLLPLETARSANDPTSLRCGPKPAVKQQCQARWASYQQTPALDSNPLQGASSAHRVDSWSILGGQVFTSTCTIRPQYRENREAEQRAPVGRHCRINLLRALLTAERVPTSAHARCLATAALAAGSELTITCPGGNRRTNFQSRQNRFAKATISKLLSNFTLAVAELFALLNQRPARPCEKC